MTIQRYRYSQSAGTVVKESDGGLMYYTDHLAAMQRERECRTKLVEALEDAKSNIDTDELGLAVIERCNAALTAAKEIE